MNKGILLLLLLLYAKRLSAACRLASDRAKKIGGMTGFKQTSNEYRIIKLDRQIFERMNHGTHLFAGQKVKGQGRGHESQCRRES